MLMHCLGEAISYVRAHPNWEETPVAGGLEICRAALLYLKHKSAVLRQEALDYDMYDDAHHLFNIVTIWNELIVSIDDL
jgi:hypothetical protein